MCGVDVRPLCNQGHRSAPDSRFCDTCGALLAAEPAAAAAELPAAGLVTDYTSGSFSDFFAEDATGRSDDGTPIRPGAASAASGKAAVSSAAAASAAAHVRRARRWQSLGMGLAVLIAAAIIGDFALHHHAGHQAKATDRPLGTSSTASASAAATAAPSPSPTAPASATRAPAPVPTPAAVPAQRVIPAATGRPRDPADSDGQYRGFLPPSRDVLPGWPFLPHEFGDGQRQAILRIVLPFSGFPPGGLPDHGGFHQR
jgi:hypothetical protein